VKRLAAILTLLLAAAIAFAGCGSGSSGSTEDALSYMPKDAPLVLTVDTDPDGEQWQNVDDLLAKFPGAGVAKSQFKQAISQGSGGKVDYDRDIKPLLGNELVIAATDISALRGNNAGFIGALKVEDEDKARELIESQGGKKAGTAEGADIYSGSGSTYAIQDGTVVFASTRQQIDDALKRHADDSGMTTDDFDALLGGLGDEDALLRTGLDVGATIDSNPNSTEARKIKWVDALENFGQIVTVEDDGVASKLRVTTASGLAPTDLPFAEGAQAPEVVRRAGELGFGLRDAAQTVHFAEQVARVSDPQGFARYSAGKRRASRVLGIDLDKDVIDQFSGDATISVSLGGDVAFRSDVKDPEALKATLAKAVPRLKKLRPGRQLGVSTPPGSGEGLYAVAQPGGDKLVFGIVDDSFVAATDAARAGQVGGQSPSTVPGARGAFAMALDARTLLNEELAKRGQGTAAQLVTGALGDFTGSVESEPDGLSGSFKLTIK
jgi:hypothetical protein